MRPHWFIVRDSAPSLKLHEGEKFEILIKVVKLWYDATKWFFAFGVPEDVYVSSSLVSPTHMHNLFATRCEATLVNHHDGQYICALLAETVLIVILK